MKEPIRTLTTVIREVRDRLVAGEDLSKETFLAVHVHNGVEYHRDIRVTVHGKKFTMTDVAHGWSWSAPIVPAQRSEARGLRCPCCRQVIPRGDVWYDCRCFQGGHKPGCENCTREPSEHHAHITATIREWGWDKKPSPGMLDYLTPGWRESSRQSRG